MTRCDFGCPCNFTTQTALREIARTYRFWGLLESILAAIEISGKKFPKMPLLVVKNVRRQRTINDLCAWFY